MSLGVAPLDTLENVHESRWSMRFRDPLRDVRLIVRLPPLEFPAPGRYQFSLTADGAWVAQTLLQVDEEE